MFCKVLWNLQICCGALSWFLKPVTVWPYVCFQDLSRASLDCRNWIAYQHLCVFLGQLGFMQKNRSFLYAFGRITTEVSSSFLWSWFKRAATSDHLVTMLQLCPSFVLLYNCYCMTTVCSETTTAYFSFLLYYFYILLISCLIYIFINHKKNIYVSERSVNYRYCLFYLR